MIIKKTDLRFASRRSSGSKESSYRELATSMAMYLAGRLNRVGVKTVVVSQEMGRKALDVDASHADFSVKDIQNLTYTWNGEEVSMHGFAEQFMSQIKQKDRTMEDAERIAKAFIESVKADPEKAGMKMLRAENMSNAFRFRLPDGSIYTPDHPMADSPEYETQKGLWLIYSNVLGEKRMKEFVSLLGKNGPMTVQEREVYSAMESEVNGSELMQRSMEVPAAKVNENRLRDIRNLIQYFEGNPDYTWTEKALIVKGAMTYGYSEKKSGEGTDVEIKNISDNNSVSVPVIGGEAAAVVEGLRKGLNFKESLKNARVLLSKETRRSVARNFTGWKVYPKSDREEDAVLLNQDVSGTGWCTGGAVSTARSHLSGGDFHVYFESGEPLIAIRTQNGRMAEPPRGAHDGQFCTDREEQIAFDYIRQGNAIVAGKEYISDIEDIRRVMSPEATWMDAFLMPEVRRYGNGEFGGDTRSWGKKVEERKKTLLAGVSKMERHWKGYYFSSELVKVADGSFDFSGVKYLKGDLNVPFAIIQVAGALQFVGGHVNVCEGATLQAPSLQTVEKNVEIEKGASLEVGALQSVGGYLSAYYGVTLQAPSLQSVGGNVTLSEDSTLQAPSLQSVGGDVSAYEGATLQAPSLQSVGGDVSAYEGATLQAPSLQSVGGDVNVREGATLVVGALQSVGWQMRVWKDSMLVAGALQSVGGDVDVREGATLEAGALQTVGGCVIVREGATLQADTLQTVGGHVSVSEGVTLQAPSLQKVGGYVTVYDGATVKAPALQSVGGDVDVCEGATLQAPALQSVEWYVAVHEGATLQVPALQTVGASVDVYEGATLVAGDLQKVGGAVTVHEDVIFQAPSLQSVEGDVHVKEGATLQAPALQSVERDVKIEKGASLEVGALQSVGGKVDVYKDATFQAPALQTVGVSVDVSEGAMLEAGALQKVGGNVIVRDGVALQVPALQSVGGDVDVYGCATLQVPALQSVGGNVFVREGSTLQASVLQTVGGDVFVVEGATFEAGALQKVGGSMEVDNRAMLNAPLLKRDFFLSDGVVYGYQMGDTIYLTPEGINPNTPIHEYAHLWAKVYQRLHPDEWEAVKDELRGNALYEQIARSKEYAFISGDDNRLTEEVFARLVGDKGESLLLSAAEETFGESLDKDLVRHGVERFRERVTSMVCSDVFGAPGLERTGKVTLQVLKDFSEGRRLGAVQKEDFHRVAASVGLQEDSKPSQKPGLAAKRVIRKGGRGI